MNFAAWAAAGSEEAAGIRAKAEVSAMTKVSSLKKWGWFYLRPFCWVSLTAKKWLARRLVRRKNPTKDIGMLNPTYE